MKKKKERAAQGETCLDLRDVPCRRWYGDLIARLRAEVEHPDLESDKRTRLRIDDTGHVCRDFACVDLKRGQERGSVSLPECDGGCLLHILVLPAHGFLGFVQEGHDRVGGSGGCGYRSGSVALCGIDDREDATFGRFPTANGGKVL